MSAPGPPAYADTAAARPPAATIRPQGYHHSLPLFARRSGGDWRLEVPRLSLADQDVAPATSGPATDLLVRGALGEGGMGRVLLAHQQSLGRDVAVKTLKAEAPAEATERLLVEGRVTGSLEHPGIVPVHALGSGPDGAPLLVMKRIDGVSLRDLIEDRRHPLLRLLPGGHEDPLQGILWVLAQVSNALHFAHSRGIIHRDVKPENIMVGGFGEVYLLDWGIALDAAAVEGADAGELAGTPAYMAPEMAGGGAGPITPRTDVYLLGATLHEVLTGAPRHGGRTLDDVLDAARRSAPPTFPPEVPAELAALCEQATARDPARRPESALRFRQALDDYLQHRGAEALCADGEERLRELKTLIASQPRDRAAIQRTGIECRFAFALALRAWPESRAARDGRRRCLSLLCEEAIDLRQAAEAAALCAEIEPPDERLRQRLQALQEALKSEADEAAAALRLLRESDEQTGARVRVYQGIFVLTLGLGFSLLTQGLRLPTHGEMVRLMAIVMGLLVLALAIWRKRLLRNAYSRRMVGLLGFLTAACLVNRLLGAARQTAVPEVLLLELAISAIIPGTAAIVGHWKLLPGALLCLAGLGLGLAFPGQIALIHPVAFVAAQISYLAIGVGQDRRGAEPSPEAPGQ